VEGRHHGLQAFQPIRDECVHAGTAPSQLADQHDGAKMRDQFRPDDLELAARDKQSHAFAQCVRISVCGKFPLQEILDPGSSPSSSILAIPDAVC
jgi:hypothetical protein